MQRRVEAASSATARPEGRHRNAEEDIKLAVGGNLSADWTKIDLDDRTIASNCIKRQEKCKEEYTDRNGGSEKGHGRVLSWGMKRISHAQGERQVRE
ncbi:MAG: hypothetical protein WAK48_16885 [Candidatus Acidiferrum sp.]